MVSNLKGYASGATGPAFKHFAITPANTDLDPIPRALWVATDGDLIIRDVDGVDLTYSVTAGTQFPFRAIQVRIGTTATVIGWG